MPFYRECSSIILLWLDHFEPTRANRVIIPRFLDFFGEGVDQSQLATHSSASFHEKKASHFRFFDFFVYFLLPAKAPE
jgi:hypothetical protein